MWEPFGGLAPAAVVSVVLGRHCSTAEQDARLVTAARTRLQALPIQLMLALASTSQTPAEPGITVMA